jgi:proton glutamate symport protein
MPPAGRPPGRFAFRSQSLTAWSLAALAFGLSLGLLGHATGDPRFGALARDVGPIGELWVAALQMTVLPLVIALMLAAVVGMRREGALGALAGRAVLLFVAMLAAAGLVTAVLTPPIVRLYSVGSATITALKAGASIPEAARQAAGTGYGSFGDWFAGLLPRNLFEAAVRGDLLPLLLFTVLLGVAVARLPDEQREPLTRLFQALAAAMLTCARWILALTPAGVFVFSFRLALGTGGEALEVLGTYIAIASGLLLLCTALLYPVTALLGRTSMRRFARAVAPAQLIAITTRSSIASLPALIYGGRERLRLPDSATGLVLPLSVSVFKLDLTVSHTVKLIFLAYVYGVPLGPTTLAAFLLSVMILSFSAPGLPSGGSFRALPAYLAAGVPIEGVVIVQAVETIPDIFQTLLNVTGDMSAATLLSRSSRAARREETAVAPSMPAPNEAELAGP